MKIKRNLIKKLRNIVSLGHVPNRELENYFYITQNNEDVCMCINCFAHACFNLSNEDIEMLGITEKHGQFFGNFNGFFTTPDEGLERQIVDFVEKTGLQMRPVLKHDEALNRNQWKVAMYIDHMNWFGKDFHFFLQEKDGSWSHKQGYSSNVQKKETIGEKHQQYDYYKTFIITNPFAREF